MRIKIGAKAICDPTQAQPEGVFKGWGNSFYLFDPSPVKSTIINTKLGKQKYVCGALQWGNHVIFRNPFTLFIK